MDTEIAEHFARIIQQANALLHNVTISTDSTPERSILRLTAEYGKCRVIATELWNRDERKYSYYVLRGTYIEAGFDNSPDPQAIRLKFGRIGSEHEQEYVPHLHTENKQRLTLTDEIDFHFFLEWLTNNVPRT